MTGHDVVVVGGGGAGAVLAARLSEDPGRRVLLLEDGPAARELGAVPGDLLDAGRVPGAMPRGAWNRWYPAELAPGRDYTVTRGRVLGGSTATNGAYFIRPRRADFERWSAAGDGSWEWDRVLPLLRDLERDLDHGATPVHGGGGAVPVRRGGLDSPAARAFVDAALAAGHPFEADKNAEGVPGVGPVPSNAADGVRWSTALTHLLPALGQPNLEVRGGCRVVGVRVRGGRAVGVEVATGDGLLVVEGDEIVLCAGALASPRILLRSGIGPADELRRAGVDVVLDAPGVGAAFGDHPQVVVEWLPRHDVAAPDGRWVGAVLAASSAGGDPGGDIEVLQSLVGMRSLTEGGRGWQGEPLPFLVSSTAPVNGGRLRIGSSAPDADARIEFGYLRTADDRRRLRDAVRLVAAITAGPVFRSVSDGLVGVDHRVLGDDRELDGWVRSRLGTALHTCGTVPFRTAGGVPGPVDQHGVVRGLDGLRVADTSILPTAPLRGPAVAAVLIGELVARAMA